MLRVVRECSDAIRERAEMADRYATTEAAALRSLAISIDLAARDWAAIHYDAIRPVGGAR